MYFCTIRLSPSPSPQRASAHSVVSMQVLLGSNRYGMPITSFSLHICLHGHRTTPLQQLHEERVGTSASLSCHPIRTSCCRCLASSSFSCSMWSKVSVVGNLSPSPHAAGVGTNHRNILGPRTCCTTNHQRQDKRSGHRRLQNNHILICSTCPTSPANLLLFQGHTGA